MSTKNKGKNEELILWFDEIDKNDIAQVGGKNASLGEMIQYLEKKDIRVPKGFAVYQPGIFVHCSPDRRRIVNIDKTSSYSELRKNIINHCKSTAV